MKKLRHSYDMRPETIINLMHGAYVIGFVSGVCNAESTDAEPVPMDKGGPETAAWVAQQCELLKTMKRRRDGTFYLPDKKS